LPLRTRHTGDDSTGWKTYDPAYRTSESGESLHYNCDGVFYDHKHGEEFGVLSLLAAEEGIISNPWDRLAKSDWWDAIEAARDNGAPIPEYDGSGNIEPVAVLPPAVRDLSTATTGWDWKHVAGRDGDTLIVQEGRERTVEAIVDAYERRDQVLIEALPTMGKSYGALKAAAETDLPVTIFTGRGQKEQYDQIKEWCEKHGLSYLQLPSFIATATPQTVRTARNVLRESKTGIDEGRHPNKSINTLSTILVNHSRASDTTAAVVLIRASGSLTRTNTTFSSGTTTMHIARPLPPDGSLSSTNSLLPTKPSYPGCKTPFPTGWRRLKTFHSTVGPIF
jgi:hypothetical protein